MSAIKQQLQELLQSGTLELTSTHARLCVPIIERIYKKMKAKVPFEDICVEHNAILNGHHRYLASMLAEFPLGTMPGIRSMAKQDCDWIDVVLVDEDWDTEAKIKMFDQQDAALCGISIEELLAKIG